MNRNGKIKISLTKSNKTDFSAVMNTKFIVVYETNRNADTTNTQKQQSCLYHSFVQICSLPQYLIVFILCVRGLFFTLNNSSWLRNANIFRECQYNYFRHSFFRLNCNTKIKGIWSHYFWFYLDTYWKHRTYKIEELSQHKLNIFTRKPKMKNCIKHNNQFILNNVNKLQKSNIERCAYDGNEETQ